MSLTKNLVSSVLELKRILGVYTASNIQSLWIRSEKGLTALATTTEEETKPKNKTNSQKESRESLGESSDSMFNSPDFGLWHILTLL